MIAWHASPYSFRRFNTSGEGAHFGTREQAENLRKLGKKPAKAYHLDIKNPLRIRDMGVWTLDSIATELLHCDILTQDDYDAIRAEYMHSDARGYAALKAVLNQLGYDGFVYDNEQEGEGDSYVAFYSKQIKPVTGVVEAVVSRLLEDEDDEDPKEFVDRHPDLVARTVEIRDTDFSSDHPNPQACWAYLLWKFGRIESQPDQREPDLGLTPEDYARVLSQHSVEVAAVPFTAPRGRILILRSEFKPEAWARMCWVFNANPNTQGLCVADASTVVAESALQSQDDDEDPKEFLATRPDLNAFDYFIRVSDGYGWGEVGGTFASETEAVQWAKDNEIKSRYKFASLSKIMTGPGLSTLDIIRSASARRIHPDYTLGPVQSSFE